MSPSRHSSKSFGGRRRKTTTASHAALAEKVLLQPWFLPRRVTFAIHGLVPVDFWKKMRNVFDDYGCLICGAGSNYHSNGMCRPCNTRTRKKVLSSARATRDADESYDWTLSYSARNSSPKNYSAVLPLMVRPSRRTDALESYSITLSMKPWLLDLNARENRFSVGPELFLSAWLSH